MDNNSDVIGRVLGSMWELGANKAKLTVTLRRLLYLTDGSKHPKAQCGGGIDDLYPEDTPLPPVRTSNLMVHPLVVAELNKMYMNNSLSYPKIKMIKHLRGELRCGLKEAKDWVEANYANK